ncbi:MAG: metal transporter [Vicinamibacterales bacterium]
MIPNVMAPPAAARATLWLWALVPLLLLAVLIAAIVRLEPASRLRPEGTPPVERLTIERVTLAPDGIHLTVMNDGPDPITLAQVTVDDAYWAFTAERSQLGHLASTAVHVPYPWVAGEAHLVKILTSTGTPFEHEIAVAVETPKATAAHLAAFALIGLYVGVLPVALGLCWFPVLARLKRRGLDVLLAVTIGLLAFLLVDAVQEGLEGAAQLAGAFQGTALFIGAAGTSYLGLEVTGQWLRALRARRQDAALSAGSVLALLIAIGIGLHNFGEGLAIGAAFALGEAALGTLLIVGFTLHNTTEGLAILAPIAKERPSVALLIKLGLIGGVPTIAGAWLGGFVYSRVAAVMCLGLGAGAIAQVIHQLSRQVGSGQPGPARFATASTMLGLLAGFAVMYATGMLVG